MKAEKIQITTDERGYFFVAVNLLVEIVVVMAVISVGVMLYGGLQFIGRQGGF